MSTDSKLELPIINHQPAAYRGPSRDEVLALRTQYLSPGLIKYYKDPLMIVEGHMQYVYDETGKRYLDGFAGNRDGQRWTLPSQVSPSESKNRSASCNTRRRSICIRTIAQLAE